MAILPLNLGLCHLTSILVTRAARCLLSEVISQKVLPQATFPSTKATMAVTQLSIYYVPGISLPLTHSNPGFLFVLAFSWQQQKVSTPS